MKRYLLGALLVLFAAQIASAHHAANTKYDETKKAKLTGTVTKVEWMNPHIYFYIDVKDASGKVTTWAIEGAPPNVLYRRGWGKDALKIGDVVTVEGFSPLASRVGQGGDRKLRGPRRLCRTCRVGGRRRWKSARTFGGRPRPPQHRSL